MKSVRRRAADALSGAPDPRVWTSLRLASFITWHPSTLAESLGGAVIHRRVAPKFVGAVAVLPGEACERRRIRDAVGIGVRPATVRIRLRTERDLLFSTIRRCLVTPQHRAWRCGCHGTELFMGVGGLRCDGDWVAVTSTPAETIVRARAGDLVAAPAAPDVARCTGRHRHCPLVVGVVENAHCHVADSASPADRGDPRSARSFSRRRPPPTLLSHRAMISSSNEVARHPMCQVFTA